MMLAITCWTLAVLVTSSAILWAQHTHPERYTKEAVARRWAMVEQEEENDGTD